MNASCGKKRRQFCQTRAACSERKTAALEHPEKTSGEKCGQVQLDKDGGMYSSTRLMAGHRESEL